MKRSESEPQTPSSSQQGKSNTDKQLSQTPSSSDKKVKENSSPLVDISSAASPVKCSDSGNKPQQFRALGQITPTQLK